ncbi:MAG: M20/M25/M40 family metallo-hydrolase [Planctomycetota bacterium]|nr:MAG: M20/M25/M40 family metallo-hydrolase [Planctomycetota bacterium]
MPRLDDVLARLEADEKAGLDRLMDWLRIPSVATDPAHAEDTRRAARWCADRLREAGIDATVEETGTPDKPGAPVVWAQHAGAPGYAGPHVLFYGHYDVQPPDPLDLWESPPFEPVVKPAEPGGPGERVVARGAVDDKGQVSTFLDAVRAWKEAAGGVPVRFTVLIEGEEESGSVNLERFIESRASDLKQCDVALISDTGMPSPTQPGITYGMRGLVYTEIFLHGADQDLHSGLWGGRAPNPNSELVKVLAQLWDDDYRVTIPGFYDDVLPLADEEREEWRRLGFDQVEALRKIGLGPEADVGEAGYSAIEREWARPTAEINGISGGYTGPGAKTVIPAVAGAKVSFRLVADQRPERIRDAFFAWLTECTPKGCRWEFVDHGGGPPGNVARDSAHLQAARRALAGAAGGTEPVLIKSGGSIPVVGMLKEKLGLDTILMGFGLDDDRVHSPNEKFELDCWRLGRRAHTRLIGEFAGAD